MKKYKVCFWLNVPSNHQTPFLEALYRNDQIDLQVRYFDKPSEERLKLGWRDENLLYVYEKYVKDIDDALQTLGDWKERIHIVTGYSYEFNRILIPLLINNQVKWVHWSERYGMGLSQLLNYNITLFKLLRPLFLLTKRSYGKLVDKYAFGCFAQGELARRDFIKMDIDKNKIENLFYATAPRQRTDSLGNIFKNFPYKYKFLFVGKLYDGKGIEDLLIAFSNLEKANDWGLVLLGDDTSTGDYKKITKTLCIDKKILFVDKVQADKVNAYYSHCNVFILPSRYDGWGAVVSEAASIGLPIIASDQTGAAFHLIENDKNGYLVGAGNKSQLTKAMQKYVSDTKLISEHGEYSKNIVQGFSPENNVVRFVKALEKWTKNESS